MKKYSVELDTEQRLPHLRLAEEPVQLRWTRAFILRGLTAL